MGARSVERLVSGLHAAGWVVLGTAAAAYVALYMHLPIQVNADFAYDDGWFYERAKDLADGKWLGPYSRMTLIKGPGYAFFLALNHQLGLSIALAHALLQTGACALFATGVKRISGSRFLAGAVFLACLWHPYLFTSRVIRDAIYAPQSLLFLGCLLHLVAQSGRGQRLAWSVGAGLSLAWLWLTREEGVWIIPGVALLCLGSVWRNQTRLGDVLRMALTMVCAMAALAACNFAAYGAWSVVEFKGGAYSRAVNALQSVRVGSAVPYVPVPAKVREQIYGVSPSFAALRSYFEGKGKHWITPGCEIYPSTCDDYAGGWFIWALREGADSLGAYRTPANANRFYETLASEVKAACRSGRLICSRGLIDYLPSITAAQWRTVPDKLRQLARMLLVQDPPDQRWNSTGEPAQLEAAWDFLGYPRRNPSMRETLLGPGPSLSGWYYAPASMWLQMRCSAGEASTVVRVAHAPSPDIAEHFHDPAANDRRFSVRLPPGQDCNFQLEGAGPADPNIGLGPRSPHGSQLGYHTLYIDTQTRAGDTPDRLRATAELNGVARLYQGVTPVLVGLAAAAYLAHLVQLGRGAGKLDVYWWTTHALWLMAAARCIILLLVDVSSFPGLTKLYIGPVFPLVMSALFLTVGLPLRRPASRQVAVAAQGPLGNPAHEPGLTVTTPA